MGSLDSLSSERSSASKFRDSRRGTSRAQVLFGNRTYNLHFYVRLSAQAHRMIPPFLTCACLCPLGRCGRFYLRFPIPIYPLIHSPLAFGPFPAAIRFTNLRRPLFLHLVPSKGTHACARMLDLAIQCSEGSSQVDGLGGRRYREGQ